jgi:RNA polymerase sigma-70 factor (ECF subfamily)
LYYQSINVVLRPAAGASVDTDPASAERLLEQARQGRPTAFEELFARHRAELHRAVALRLDRRLTARVDASDVLQETYLEAVRRLPDYLRRPEMPFELWLRWLAREQVLMCHRRHLGADKRAVTREVPALPADSSAQFVCGLLSRGPSPSQALAAAELAERLRLALQQLDDDERELILFRHFEQLSNREVAQVLRVSEAAANKRYIRALQRLRGVLLSLGVSGTQ